VQPAAQWLNKRDMQGQTRCSPNGLGGQSRRSAPGRLGAVVRQLRWLRAGFWLRLLDAANQGVGRIIAATAGPQFAAACGTRLAMEHPGSAANAGRPTSPAARRRQQPTQQDLNPNASGGSAGRAWRIKLSAGGFGDLGARRGGGRQGKPRGGVDRRRARPNASTRTKR